MGMGEPLYNFDNVRDAEDRHGRRRARPLKRRITLSTSGVVPMMAVPARRSVASPSRCTP
jgi:23S rRNA (adenine2503-C2)-methyltransferase